MAAAISSIKTISLSRFTPDHIDVSKNPSNRKGAFFCDWEVELTDGTKKTYTIVYVKGPKPDTQEEKNSTVYAKIDAEDQITDDNLNTNYINTNKDFELEAPEADTASTTEKTESAWEIYSKVLLQQFIEKPETLPKERFTIETIFKAPAATPTEPAPPAAKTPEPQPEPRQESTVQQTQVTSTKGKCCSCWCCMKASLATMGIFTAMGVAFYMQYIQDHPELLANFHL